jgi:hypothetical protein
MGAAVLALAACSDNKQTADCKRYSDTQQYNDCKEGTRHGSYGGGAASGSVYHHSYLPLPYAIGTPSSPVRYGSGSSVTTSAPRPSGPPAVLVGPPPATAPTAIAAPARVGPPPASAPVSVARGGFGGSAVSSASS